MDMPLLLYFVEGIRRQDHNRRKGDESIEYAKQEGFSGIVEQFVYGKRAKAQQNVRKIACRLWHLPAREDHQKKVDIDQSWVREDANTACIQFMCAWLETSKSAEQSKRVRWGVNTIYNIFSFCLNSSLCSAHLADITLAFSVNVMLLSFEQIMLLLAKYRVGALFARFFWSHHRFELRLEDDSTTAASATHFLVSIDLEPTDLPATLEVVFT